MTYGRLPRSANSPNLSPSDHCKNISASIRALSLWPDANKWGSARIKSPSGKFAQVDCSTDASMTYLWKRVRLCNVAGRDHQKGKYRTLTTICNVDKPKEESGAIGTHAVAFSTNVFLHVPSDPVRASNCVNLPKPNPMLNNEEEIYTQYTDLCSLLSRVLFYYRILPIKILQDQHHCQLVPFLGVRGHFGKEHRSQCHTDPTSHIAKQKSEPFDELHREIFRLEEELHLRLLST